MKAVALMGAHRTGKTTLAKAFAEKKGWDFVSCSVSPAYKAVGIPMGEETNFSERILIQDTALKLYTQSLNKQLTTGKDFISDRCFLDLIAYTLADFPNTASTGESVWISDYINKCLLLNQQYFHSVALLRPGIPLKEDMTSWGSSSGIVDKVDACMLWSAEQAKDIVFPIPKETLDLNERLTLLEVIASESWI